MPPYDDYMKGLGVVMQVVGGWTGADPVFRFTHAEVGLIADLRDVGQYLAVNEAARELQRRLVKRCVDKTGQAPTAMMLLAALEHFGHPVQRVDFADLNIPGRFVRPHGYESN